MLKIFICLGVLLALCGVAKGQEGNNTKYFLENLPERFRLNPAYQPEYKTFIGIPGLSGIGVSYNNSGFSVESLLRKGKDDSVYMDVNRFHKALNRRNFMMLNNENTILALGFRAKKGWYWSLDLTQKNDFLFSFNRDIFTFIKNGNAPYVGQNMDFGRLGLKGSSYLEFAIGLSKKVDDKLTVGGRVKFLRGIANVDTKDSEMSVYTSPDAEHVRLSSKQDIRVSAPLIIGYDKDNFVDWDKVEFNDDKVIRSLLSTRNIGFAMDFGAEYRLQERIKLYASLLDLGFIRWGSNTFSFTQNTTFDWQGGNISNSISSNNPGYVEIGDVFDDLIDSLKDNFRFNDNQGRYTTMLRAKLHLGATYDLNDWLNFGALAKASIVDKAFYPGLTLSANTRVCRNFGASMTYTTMYGNYVNLGIGFTAKAGPLQLYAVTDNLLATNFTNTRSASFTFGINILTGHKDFKPREKRKGPRTRTEINVRNTPTENIYEVRKKVGNQRTDVSISNLLEPKRDTIRKWDTIYLQVPVKDTSLINPPVQVAASDTLASAPANKLYSVIVGSFVRERGAVQVKRQFVKRGYEAAAIRQNDKGMFQVCIISFGTIEQARAVATEIRTKHPENNDVWILTQDI